MDQHVHEKRLPHLAVILPMESTPDDAVEVAREQIRTRLDLKCFEICHVQLMETGQIQTPNGVVNGKRYIVAFQQTHPEVIFEHPDFAEIMKRGTQVW